MENTPLGGLDYSDVEHIFSADAVSQSWNGDLVDGNIVYPVIDYGSDGQTNVFEIDNTLSNGTIFTLSLIHISEPTRPY